MALKRARATTRGACSFAVTTLPRRVSNPPNPWASAHVEWLEEPPREVFARSR